MKDKIAELLRREYDLDVTMVKQMSGGVGGDTYYVENAKGKYVFNW